MNNRNRISGGYSDVKSPTQTQVPRFFDTARTADFSLSDLYESFLLQQRSVETKRSYRCVRLFLDSLPIDKATLGDLRQLSYEKVGFHIALYLDGYKKSEPNTHRVLNGGSVNQKRYALSSFFEYLTLSHAYPLNPVDAYPKYPARKRSNTEILTEVQLLDLFQMLSKNYRKSQAQFRDYLIIRGLFHLALRRNELAGLRWGDIDFSNHTVMMIQKGHTEKLLPVPIWYLDYLEEFGRTYGRKEYIFHPLRNNRGKTLEKPLSTSYIFRIVTRESLRLFPDKNITPHSLRACFVTLALESGEDPIAIMNATGHNSMEMVKYYDRRNQLRSNAIHAMGAKLHK